MSRTRTSVIFIGASSLIDATGEEAAVDGQHFAVDETGSMGGEKDARAGQLLHVAEAPHRRAKQELLAALGAVEQLRVERGAIDARRDGVHVDAAIAPLDGEGAGQSGHT